MELSVQEERFVRQSLVTQSVPSPKSLIYDHNTINKKRELPTRLVIPATNFTMTFSKIGYLGIEWYLDKGKVRYWRVSIVQAFYPKERLEELKINRDEATMASFDAINMYPSIKIATIRKAVKCFSRKLTSETKNTINLCLELIHFRMISTLDLFWWRVLQVSRQRKRITRVIDWWIQTSVFSWPGCILSIWKGQSQIHPDNIPRNL